MFAPPPGYGNGVQHQRLPANGRPRRSSGKFCLKCICCCYCFLIVLLLVLAGITFYLYMEYKPEIPSYKVINMDVKKLAIDQKDLTINVNFVVHAEANNPNSHIGFKYGKDSAVDVYYKTTNLCSGQLPSFEQGHKNITVMNIEMTGKNGFGNDLQDALKENQKNGQIPLLVTVKAPVSVILGSLPLREFTVHVKCHLVIDSLLSGTKPRIVSSRYDVDASF
ncbi:NDR1/HIN1-like protein 6 [Apium graveolens]|uniref:NDR1/HIN1-like protein 6 n=1 Tax=Apium graveolens TaxID=4045 RepID=UPI003D7B7A39